ncbi:MAG: hypothetical protein R2692_03990 [Microbacterium sp.]
MYLGEFLGIVGESCLAMVSSLAIMGLLPSTAEITGSIEFEGRPLIGLDDAKLSRIRGKELAMVFRRPASALTPSTPSAIRSGRGAAAARPAFVGAGGRGPARSSC